MTLEQMSLRDEYGATLAEMGDSNPDIVALDADLSGSTRTSKFAQKHPERFFNIGIAEGDMVSTAAGLAAAGKLPYASTFAVFASGRAWEQVRQSVCLSNLNVKIVATHGGITVGEDGPSHQALEDITIMRVMPHMTVVVPADGYETRAVIRQSEKLVGPMYIRLPRDKFPNVYNVEPTFVLGKGTQLTNGSDVAIIACGLMVSKSLEAAEKLSADGISATVINMASIKPLDIELIIQAASTCGAIVTAEEHSIIGGLGGAVAEVVCEHEPVPVIRVGMQSEFGKSGPPEELLDYFGMNTAAIVTAAMKAISLKDKKGDAA